jgi:hypothetical protein
MAERHVQARSGAVQITPASQTAGLDELATLSANPFRGPQPMPVYDYSGVSYVEITGAHGQVYTQGLTPPNCPPAAQSPTPPAHKYPRNATPDMARAATRIMTGGDLDIETDGITATLEDHIVQNVNPELLRAVIKLWQPDFGAPTLSKFLDLEEHARLRLAIASMAPEETIP